MIQPVNRTGIGNSTVIAVFSIAPIGNVGVAWGKNRDKRERRGGLLVPSLVL